MTRKHNTFMNQLHKTLSQFKTYKQLTKFNKTINIHCFNYTETLHCNIAYNCIRFLQIHCFIKRGALFDKKVKFCLNYRHSCLYKTAMLKP